MNKKLLLIATILFSTSISFANTCETELKSTDKMTFDKKEIIIPKTCKEFLIKLSHVGKMDKKSMGHNVVITKTTDSKKVATDGVKAGVKNDYIKPNDKRVIAHSTMLGGGEKTEIKVDVSKLSGDESFFCSFPGHQSQMSGKIILN